MEKTYTKEIKENIRTKEIKENIRPICPRNDF
jgi:hypothetical protein